MQVILDYLGSVAIGGTVLLSIFGFYGDVGGAAVSTTLNVVVQENLSSVTDLLEYDLRKAGYAISDSVKIALADTNRIAFRGDFDDNGTPDSVCYYVGNASLGSAQMRVLYRKLNNQPVQTLSKGVTTFNVLYFDRQGNTVTGSSLTALASIRSVKVSIAVVSEAECDGTRPGAYWERVMKPKNLR